MIFGPWQHWVVLQSFHILYCLWMSNHALFRCVTVTRYPGWFYTEILHCTWWLCNICVIVGFWSLFVIYLIWCLPPRFYNFTLHLDCSSTESICFLWNVLLLWFLAIAFTLPSRLRFYVLGCFTYHTTTLDLFNFGLFRLICLKRITGKSVDLVSLIGYLLIVFHEKFAHRSWFFRLLCAIWSLCWYWNTNFATSNRVKDAWWRCCQLFVTMLCSCCFSRLSPSFYVQV